MDDVESLWYELRINSTHRFPPARWKDAFVLFKELLEVCDAPDLTLQIGRLTIYYNSAHEKFFLSGKAPPHLTHAVYGKSLRVITAPVYRAQFLRGILLFTHDSFRKQWDIYFENATLTLVKTYRNELQIGVKKVSDTSKPQ